MQQKKIGILGGGQLGRMLLSPAIDLDIELHFLENDSDAPCSAVSKNFYKGDISNYQDVLDFGRNMDIISIEIEKVSADALEQLEKEGKKVFPQPAIIRLIQDKRLQKQFYKENNIPTSDFVLIDNKKELINYLTEKSKTDKNLFPIVQKLGKDGYDGKGVQILKNLEDAEQNGFEAPSLLEEKVDIEKEISVVIARNEKGEIAVFDAVEMVVNKKYNLLDYLLAPARITESQKEEAIQLATEVVTKLGQKEEINGMVGLLAVELFIDKQGKIVVNEVAPRPHNSGHHTIEACTTSQYAQHLRSVMNLPLGKTNLRSSAAILNLIGEENHAGTPFYEGLDKLLELENVYPHIYGKKITKAGRKMGHITILGNDIDSLKEKIDKVKSSIRVIAK